MTNMAAGFEINMSSRSLRRSFIAVLFLSFLLVKGNAATLPSGFSEAVIATGLSSPTAMAFAPDGRLFVCQQGGQLRVIKNGALLTTPFVTVPVDNSGERGLLGIAFDPNFAVNRFVYIYYTATSPAIHNRVSRFTANGDVAVSGSEVVLLDLNNLSGASNHNGGGLHFGLDGKLYIAVGENANSANSQTLGNLLGKMLRLNSDGSIPTDNPFYNTASGVNRAIWALGLRNPFTFAVQPGTGRLFINDVGQDTWEEIDDGVAGANYGWPNCEAACSPSNPNYRNPIFQYQHGSGNSSGYCIAGGAFYNPATAGFPASFVGDYFFADYVNGWIRVLDPANGNQVTGFATGINAPIDLKVGMDGRLYYLARGNGAVYAISYTASQTPQITQQPSDQTVLAGQAATFTVAASGPAPLNYQWRRNNTNIPGATTTSYTLTATAADAGAAFRCVVTNPSGSVTSNPALLQLSTNNPPSGTITLPVNGALFTAGNTIQYSGTANDPEDGNLSSGRFSWTVVFYHDTHTHPFLGPINGVTNGSFVIPTQGETATNIWYRINLTVTDSAGQTQTTFRDVRPRTATINLATSPAGLQLTMDGQPVPTPYAVGSVVGMERTIGVVSPQVLNGTTYEFVSWSDGGAAAHVINTPTSATTYTATFRAVASGTLHYDFTYADRTSLLAGGWDFLARTATGATRNTEQTTGVVVDYNQASHLGVLRIPTDVGDLWRAANDSRNSLFRNLPGNWTSVRLKLTFAPTQNYQQAGLIVYQDDDNYVQVTREYNSGNKMAFIRELGGTPDEILAISVTATANLHLRLDRDAATSRISGYFSLDGASWTAMGNVTQTLNNPRLGIFVGASPGGYPNADLAWAEVMAPTQANPILTVTPGNLNFSTTTGGNPANQSVGIINNGGGTLNWTAVADASAPAWLTITPTSGSGNGAVNVSVASANLAAGNYTKNITVTSPGTTNSPQTVTVNLTVASVPPSLVVTPTALNFTVTQGGNPANQTFAINNSGGGILSWAVGANATAPAWLTVSPTNGSGSGTVSVSVVSASLAVGNYAKTITVTAAGASNSPQTVTVNLTVNAPSGSGTNHYDFTYADRAGLLASGWNFLARTAAGASRNTEQTSGAVVNYSQATHPGVLRIPVDTGDLWGTLNSTRNSLFRDIPTNWTSLRLKLSFAPTQNYQQAGLVVYQNDDNYVQITRIYNGGNKISFVRETGGTASVLQSVTAPAAANLLLRLDRDPATSRISSYYSVDGTTWTAVGNGVIQAVSNPRLAIILGASPGGLPDADLAWAEIIAPVSASAAPISNLSISIVAPGLTNDRFHFAFPTQFGMTYVVECKNELSGADWQPLTSVIGTGEIVTVEDPARLGVSRFYRIRMP
jgi:glucose/arabinose dehydrogenase/regulation of enolase protein 1 (concanavalin A-like superfamily)